MAQLIPAFIEDSAPSGERAVFNMLAAGPSDWLVFHSLDLAPWNKQRQTEIDFAVVIPDTGILCIEVKSHPEIRFEGGLWHPLTIKRSPFRQAADAAFALHRRLKAVAPELQSVPVTHCCVFPNAVAQLEASLVVRKHELIDATEFRSFSDGSALCRRLKEIAVESVDADVTLWPLKQPLAPAVVAQLQTLMAPVALRKPERRTQIEARYRHLEDYLRPHQKTALKLVATNDRVVISGPAGTGKTQVALEVARRQAETGARVGLVCFNRLVGMWIRRETSSWGMPNLVGDRALRLMAGLCDIAIPNNPDQAFWEHELPERIEEALTSKELSTTVGFDYLVIDEAQDLLGRPWLWQCLMHLLTEGETGRFCALGDFDYQVLSGGTEVGVGYARLRKAGCATFTLDENCRNLRLVGGAAVALSGMPKGTYSGYLRQGGGLDDLTLLPYGHQRSQPEALGVALRKLKAEGFKPGEIAILSLCEPQASAAAQLAEQGWHLVPAGGDAQFTQYTSAHAFKGLESRVVVVTDITEVTTAERRNALYVAMTRSTGPLTLIFDQLIQEQLAKTLAQSLNATKN